MLKNMDKFNMKKVIAESPEQLVKGLDLAKGVKVEGTFKNVIICGMGGSALPANILNALTHPNIPIYIHRDYGLPKEADMGSLIICVSYSGNTEETVSALKKTISRGFKVVSIATGGKLEKISKQNNIILVKIPSGIQPRSATGYMFSVLAVILSNCGIISDISNDILKTAESLKKISSKLEKQGKNIAQKLKNKIPVVYASNNFKTVARIWKIKFNENSKIPAFCNYFPELNHNEMVGFTQTNKKNNFFVLIIKNKDDHSRIAKRMALTSSILNKKGIKTEFIETEGDFAMSRLFACLLLGDWISYQLGMNYKIDPTPVKMVEDFKKMMG